MTTASRVKATLDLVQQRTGGTVIGAYLQSFGATRSLTALAEAHEAGLGWVVLESPGPVVGTDATRLMEARRRAMLKLFSVTCKTASCFENVARSVVRFARTGAKHEASGREIALGLIGLATLPQGNDHLLKRVSRELQSGTLTADSASQLKLLGRLHGGKSPRMGLHASVVGLWADTCPRLKDWDVLRSSEDPILQGFSWIFRGCAFADESAEKSIVVSNKQFPAVLMLTGAEDTIVPPSIQSDWVTPSLKVRRITGTGHFWEDSAVASDVVKWISSQERRR